MRQHEQEFEELSTKVRIVTFDADVMAKLYAQQTELQWPLLVDHARSLYKAYGFLHGSWWDITGPIAIWKYVKLIFKGNRLNKPGEDWLQMGGNVIVGPQGIILMHYLSKTPHDRPTIEQIFEVIKNPEAAV